MDTCRHKGKIIWITGLSGSGKSTIAASLKDKLIKMGIRVYLLDGDVLRCGLNQDLGFSQNDRKENIRRTAHVAALFYDAGIMTIVSVISPHDDMRQYARSLVPEDDFIEVFVKTHIEECIKRDPKGLYKRAINNEIPDFTGISSPYEEPKNPNIIIPTEKTSADQAAKMILDICCDIKDPI